MSAHYASLSEEVEVRKLLQDHDWSAFALGAPGSWDVSFKTALQLMLESPQPAFMLLGPDPCLFITTLIAMCRRGRHPLALARPYREVWPATWLDLAPMLKRAQAETAGTILVAISGYGQGQNRNSALDAGFDHDFIKPVDSAKLAGLLHGMVRWPPGTGRAGESPA